jgi:phosphatidate cytidylyltransferase
VKDVLVLSKQRVTGLRRKSFEDRKCDIVLSTRIWAAVFFVPLLLVMVWVGGTAFAVGCVFLSQMILWEALRLLNTPRSLQARVFAHVLGLWVALLVMGFCPVRELFYVLPVALMGGLVLKLLNPEPLQESIPQTAALLFAVLYACGLVPYWFLLRAWPEQGLGLALMALLCTWASDTGAYFVGRAFGKKKLYPVISPGKTWAGVWGGVLVSVLAACGVRFYFLPQLPLHDAVALGGLAAVCGTLGDLCESMLKRSVGVKDSSSLIPGHGGFLDRFDALLFVVPAFYLYLR